MNFGPKIEFQTARNEPGTFKQSRACVWTEG
jgi:hypothetical protein